MTGDEQSLTRSVASGIGWSYASVVATFALQLIYTAVMARLLDPQDFGLMAGAFLGLRFVTYLSRFGLGSAVVQRAELTLEEQRVAFTLSVGVAGAAAAVGLLLSSPVASLIDQPEVAPVMRWLSIAVLLAACGTVPEGLLRRRMRFRLLGVAQVLSASVGYLIVGIPLAVRGWGVWSLVAAVTAQALVQFLAVAWSTRSSLRLRFDLLAMRPFLSFGGLVAATGFLEFLSSSVDTFAVGRWLGASSLGQYSRATYLVGLPVEQATTATSRVLLPSFAQIQSDSDRFNRGFLTSLSVLSLVVAVPVAMAVGAAPAIVDVVLGKGWSQAAAILPLVGLAYGLSLWIHVPAVAAEAKALVGMKFVIQLVVLILFVVAVAGVAAGPKTMLWFAAVWILAEAFRFVLFMAFVVPALGLSRRSVVGRYVAALLVASVAWIPTFVVVRVAGLQSIVGLAVAGVLGAGATALALFGLPTSKVLRADLRVIRERLRASSGD